MPLMNKKIILYIVLGIVSIGLLLLTLFPGIIYAISDAGSSGNEKCNVQPGYTEESWREHMSHHPNIYAECLG
ncbi:hypothetical protein COU60_02535 [Candidatus Pacearchaeota archaeon CG10_big_fil_rev_8_21_14_0_10_34_76]|nr:MAG: hypothetical protein COU60_02535 [Candidatus Pacearchaeota archaeon CG10_big_fil_rev_8_21_14_0_10_34_76]